MAYNTSLNSFMILWVFEAISDHISC